ncbi:MAG: UvrD-helicase domain-containing protein, partial [Planctomycetes bacterium]|nr:UvrD-helicase domain-containing protein [Planctomycetota bacterium]
MNAHPEFRIADEPLDEGTALLEASAGTGKTYTITGILLRMLLEDVVTGIDQVLVVTFTVAAADELKNRLRDGLSRALAVCRGERDRDGFFQGLGKHGKKGADKLRLALEDFDRASVTTIHSFCKQLLDEAAFESHEPFDLEFAVDESPLWNAAAADALRDLRRFDSPTLGAVLHEAQLDPTALVQLYRAWQRHPDVALDPTEPHPDTRLDTLRCQIRNAGVSWSQKTVDRLQSLQWRTKDGKPTSPWTGDPTLAIRRLGEQLSTHPELQLTMLTKLAPRALDATVLRRSHRPVSEAFLLACDDVLTAWEDARRHLLSFLLLRMHDRLQRLKQDLSVLTFDDLLVRAHRAVTDPRRSEAVRAALRARFAVALIDEFQDTDERQYQILAEAFHGRPLFLVGDPKQSIYGFRGADLGTYLAAAEDAQQRHTLGTNFRSSVALVEAVNELFRRPQTFVVPGIRMPQVRAAAKSTEKLVTGDGTAALRFRFVPATEPLKKGGFRDVYPREARAQIAADVTAEICRLLDGPARVEGDRLLPRHIAVLTRRNVEALLVQQHLRDAGVISVIGKAGDV